MLDALMFDRRLLKDTDEEFEAQLERGAPEADAIVLRRGYIFGRLQAREERMVLSATRRLGPPNETQRHEFRIIAWRDVHVQVICDRLRWANSYDELFHAWAADVPL